MSVSLQISRIQAARNTIRTKLVELGMANNTDNLDVLATAIENLVNQGAVDITVQEGQSYTIPKGYHNGSGTVKGIAGGGNYTLQAKTVTPTKKQQPVTSDEGYYGLSSVTVNAIPDAYQDVSSVNVLAGEVLTGKIFVTSDGTVTTGTMANNGAVSKTLSGTFVSYTIPKGYHSGEGTVTITLEEKSVTPTKTAQEIVPTTGKVLSKVTVAAIPAKYQDVTPVTATAGGVLDGQVFVDADGKAVTGTMPNIGNDSEVLVFAEDSLKTTHTIPAGYHNGTGKIEIVGEAPTATPTKATQVIKPSEGAVLAKVTVEPIPAAYQDVTSVDAVAANVLAGKKIVAADGSKVTGTMANNGAIAQTLDTTTKTYTVPAGYHSGAGKVQIVTEEKSATPTKDAQTIVPTDGKVLAKVSVAAIPDAYQDVTAVNAEAGDVLTGHKIVSATGAIINGAMPNNGSVANTIDGLTTSSVTIPAGYTTGGTISLTSDIEDALAAI